MIIVLPIIVLLVSVPVVASVARADRVLSSELNAPGHYFGRPSPAWVAAEFEMKPQSHEVASASHGDRACHFLRVAAFGPLGVDADRPRPDRDTEPTQL